MCNQCGSGATRRGRPWDQETKQYTESQIGIIIRKYCNAIAVRNASTLVNIVFNREVIPPGMVKQFSMHEDDEYMGTIDLEFLTTGAPGEIPLAYVTQLFYTQPQNP